MPPKYHRHAANAPPPPTTYSHLCHCRCQRLHHHAVDGVHCLIYSVNRCGHDGLYQHRHQGHLSRGQKAAAALTSAAAAAAGNMHVLMAMTHNNTDAQGYSNTCPSHVKPVGLLTPLGCCSQRPHMRHTYVKHTSHIRHPYVTHTYVYAHCV
jgi:hypothetical protein